MSILFSALAIIAVANSQTYEICATSELISGYELIVSRDATNSMVKIEISGSNAGWFGYGFGTSTMIGSYAVTVEGADSSNLGVVQRSLTQMSNPPGTTVTGGEISVTTDGSTATGVLEMAYDGATEFDFTPFLNCEVDSINLIAAKGSTTLIGNHGNSNRVPSMTLTRESSCTCTDTLAPTTMEPTAAPSEATPSPEEASSDDYEICATSELIDDVSLTVFRDATNEMLKIEISGSNTAWFGYGFGSAEMIGAYAVTVEGADSDSLGVVERTLDQQGSPPGATVTYGTSSTTTTGSTVTGSLELPYEAEGFNIFSDFLNCVGELDLIAAKGSTTTMAYHGGTSDNRVGGMTLTRESSCTCSDTPTTTASANNIFNGFYVILAVFIASLFN